MNKNRENKKNKIKSKTLKEIIIHNKLKNDNIIKYYNYIEKKNIGCIVMEYAELGDLDNLNKIINTKRYFSETLLSFITLQILQGLLSLTKSKIIHMDIKPQNILLDKNLIIKISDFSASFSYENYKKNQKILLPFSGTSLFMSPEVLSNEYIDYSFCNKVDLYSLGVVLYFLAFDQFPYGLDYSDKNNFGLILKKINCGKLIFPNINIYSSKFLKFLNKLIERDIKKRINIYEALNDNWVKGGEILFNEKEKIDDNEIFLINMITDNIRCFNEYIKNE
jgi:calcium-dependent protein kinase